MSFEELDRIIRAVFGWTGQHMSYFQIPQINTDIMDPLDIGEVITFSRCKAWDEVLISEYISMKIAYCYDPGDDWMHAVKLVEECEGDIDRPRLLKVKGDGFLEDTGGPYCIDPSDIYFGSVTKGEVALIDEIIFSDWEPSDIHEVPSRVPYSALYSLSLAVCLPPEEELYLDAETGKVYSAEDGGYFPLAEDVSEMAFLGPETRINIRETLWDHIRSNGLEAPSELRASISDDPVDLYRALSGNSRMAHILTYQMAEAGDKALRMLGLERDDEVLCTKPFVMQYASIPYSLVAKGPRCISCGGWLSNPCPDTDSKYCTLKGLDVRPLIMTCSQCGSETRMVPDALSTDYTYDGFSSPLDIVRIALDMSGSFNTLELRDAVLSLYLYATGNYRRSVETAMPLLHSEDPRIQASALSSLYPQGYVGDDEARGILARIQEKDVPDKGVAAMLSAISEHIGSEKFAPEAIKDYLALGEPDAVQAMVLTAVSGMLPSNSGIRKSISRHLLDQASDVGEDLGFILSECYCSSLGPGEPVDFTEVAPVFEYKGAHAYSSHNNLARYRRATLYAGSMQEECVRELRGMLSDIFSYSLYQPFILVRGAFAALMAHHYGVRYSKRDLIGISARWMSKARDAGYLNEDDVREYLGQFFRVAMVDHTREDIRKILRRNHFDEDVPETSPGEFDPAAVRFIRLQYRFSPIQ